MKNQQYEYKHQIDLYWEDGNNLMVWIFRPFVRWREGCFCCT